MPKFKVERNRKKQWPHIPTSYRRIVSDKGTGGWYRANDNAFITIDKQDYVSLHDYKSGSVFAIVKQDRLETDTDRETEKEAEA